MAIIKNEIPILEFDTEQKEYNKTVANNIESIATDLNTKYYNSYQQWQDELSMMIEVLYFAACIDGF